MKSRYNVMLEKEVVDFVKPFLEKKGLSFSGYLNQALVEYAEVLKRADLPDDIGKVTLEDFMNTLQRVVKGMKK